MAGNKSNITLSLDDSTKAKLHMLSGMRKMTMSDLVSEWVAREFGEQDSFFAIDEMENPVIEMVELMNLRQEFVNAVENNLVMTFEDYIEWWNADKRKDAPCEPFVYIDKYKGEYATDSYRHGDVVCDACVIGHRDIISVYGMHSIYGRPRLSTSTEDCPEDTVWLNLEYFPTNGEPIDLAPQVYLNRKTGEVRWCR